MKIAFPLVVFLGLALADNVKKVHQTKRAIIESKNDVGTDQNAVANPASRVVANKREHDIRKRNGEEHKIGVVEVLKRIYKETLDRNNETINLGREFKSKIFKIAKTRENILDLLAMQSDEDLLNITQQLVASRAATSLSTEVLMEMINTTVTGLKKLLEKAATDIRDLATLFLGHIKEYADTTTNQIRDVLKSGKRKTLKVVKKKESKMIDKLSDVSERKILESYNVSEKQILDLAHTSGVSIFKAADRETKQFQNFTADDKKLQRYVKFATRKIYDLAKNISDKYTELALGSLKSLKQLVNDTEKTVKELAHQEIQFAQFLVKKKPSGNTSGKTGRSLTEFEDTNKSHFDKVMFSIAELVSYVLEDASKNINAIKQCSPNGLCFKTP